VCVFLGFSRRVAVVLSAVCGAAPSPSVVGVVSVARRGGAVLHVATEGAVQGTFTSLVSRYVQESSGKGG
jgi:hypothetical protein